MDRCALCPNVNACIPPHGRGDILFVGEAPGGQEDRNAKKHPPGIPFIGKTGREVDDHYLPLAGLRRQSVMITNAISCLPTAAGGKLDPNRAKDIALLESCANKRLYPIIERGNFKLIVPMGSFAVRAVAPGTDLELQHGMPVPTVWGIPAFPMYHPALGMHSPKQMLYIRTDWIRLRKFLKGQLTVPEDEYPEPDYAEVTDASEIDALDPALPLAGDTEHSREFGPYFLTFSQYPGTGRLIRAGRKDLLGAFQRHLDSRTAPVLFHNWFYDYKPVAELRLRIPVRLLRDTMALVFHLGNLPQGLKTLAYRELGMLMQDFEDLVLPYSRVKVLEYYRAAANINWPKPEEELVREAGGKWKVYKPQGMNTKLKRFFTDLSKSPEKDVFGMWDNWEESHAMLEEQLGPWPGVDIAHAPFADALYYACRDADALIRLWPLIEHMKTRVRDYPQEDWRAA